MTEIGYIMGAILAVVGFLYGPRWINGWLIRLRSTKHQRFSFSNGFDDVELQCSATISDETRSGKTSDSIRFSFRLFQNGRWMGGRFCGGWNLREDLWRDESVHAGLPVVWVREGGGFVVITGEGCGQILVLIHHAMCLKSLEVTAHQILVPGVAGEEPREKPLPDGRLVRVRHIGGWWIPSLELVKPDGTTRCFDAYWPEQMSEFYRALVQTAETAATTTLPSSSPS